MAIDLNYARQINPSLSGKSDEELMQDARRRGYTGDFVGLKPEEPKPEEAGDFRSYVSIPMLKGVSDASSLASMGLNALGADKVSHLLEESNRRVNDTLTARQSQAAQEDAQKTIEDKDGNYGGYNLGTAIQDISGSVPGMVTMMAPGYGLAHVATGMAKAAKLGEGIAKIASTGVLGKGLAEGVASHINPAHISTAIGSAAGFSASEGIYSGASNAAQVQDEIRQTPLDKLAEHPMFKDVYHNETDKNLSPEERLYQTRDILSKKAANDVFAKTAIRTGLISMATGGGAMGLLRNRAVNGTEDGLLKTIGKGFATEGLQEGLQSAWEQRVMNEARRDYANPNQDVNEGVTNAGIQGGIAGGVMGASMGGGAHLLQPKKTEDAGKQDADNSETPQNSQSGHYKPVTKDTIVFDDGSQINAHEFYQDRLAEHGDPVKAKREMYMALNGNPKPVIGIPNLIATADGTLHNRNELIKGFTENGASEQDGLDFVKKIIEIPLKERTNKIIHGMYFKALNDALMKITYAPSTSENNTKTTESNADHEATQRARENGKFIFKINQGTSENNAETTKPAPVAEAAQGSAGEHKDATGGQAEFTPTHELNDGTPVIKTDENTYVDQHGEEWKADDATPIEPEKPKLVKFRNKANGMLVHISQDELDSGKDKLNGYKARNGEPLKIPVRREDLVPEETNNPSNEATTTTENTDEKAKSTSESADASEGQKGSLLMDAAPVQAGAETKPVDAQAQALFDIYLKDGPNTAHGYYNKIVKEKKLSKAAAAILHEKFVDLVNKNRKEYEHNGTRIYDDARGIKHYVETSENRERRLKGEHGIGGDAVFFNLYEARKYADQQNAEEAEASKRKKEQDKKQAEQDKKDAEKKAEMQDIDGFGENLKPHVKATVVKRLSERMNIGGVTDTLKNHVKRLVDNGATTQVHEEHKIKDKSRNERNRMTNEEQDEFNKKQKLAGVKHNYTVGDINLGKIAYDYANHLIAKKQAETKPVDIKPETKPNNEPVIMGQDKPHELTEKEKLDAELDDVLSELGDYFRDLNSFKAVPEHDDVKLFPIMVKLIDVAIMKGYYQFKDAAKYALDIIRAKFGNDAADSIQIEQLHGAYIAVHKKYLGLGANKPSDVLGVEHIDEINKHKAVNHSEKPKPKENIIENKPGSLNEKTGNEKNKTETTGINDGDHTGNTLSENNIGEIIRKLAHPIAETFIGMGHLKASEMLNRLAKENHLTGDAIEKLKARVNYLVNTEKSKIIVGNRFGLPIFEGKNLVAWINGFINKGNMSFPSDEIIKIARKKRLKGKTKLYRVKTNNENDGRLQLWTKSKEQADAWAEKSKGEVIEKTFVPSQSLLDYSRIDKKRNEVIVIYGSAKNYINDVGKINTDATHNVDANDSSKLAAKNAFDKDSDIAMGIPTFKGNKRTMLSMAVNALNALAHRLDITHIDDWFGGGGMWSTSLANAVLPNVKTIRIGDLNPLRIKRIEWMHERGDKFYEDLKRTGALDVYRKLLEEFRLNKVTVKEDGVDVQKSKPIVSPSALADIVDALEGTGKIINAASIRAWTSGADKLSEEGKVLLSALGDLAFNNRRLKIHEPSNMVLPDGTVADQFLAKVITEMAAAHKQAQVFKKRGGSYEYLPAASSYDTVASKGIKGKHVLSLVDPPYYNTTGYKGTDDFSTGDKWNAEGYQKTYDLLKTLVANENHILYTDEAWWRKTDQLGDVQQANGILKNINDLISHLKVAPNKIGDRYEQLGIHDPNTGRRSNDGGNSGEVYARGGSKGTDGQRNEHSVLHSEGTLAGRTGSESGSPAESVENKGGQSDVFNPLFSKSQKVANPHGTASLREALSRAMDRVFGAGWFGRLEATGKFKVISRADAVKLIGNHIKPSFAGESAIGADTKALEKAKALLAQGLSRDAIHDETGWFYGADKQWRYEIGDEGASLKMPIDQLEESKNFQPDIPYRLGDVVDHPKLFSAYPHLADIPLVKRSGMFDFGGLQGWFGDNGIGITPYVKDALSTILHELTHAVQKHEKWASGGNADSVINNLPEHEIMALVKKAFDNASKNLQETTRIVDTLEFLKKNPVAENFIKTEEIAAKAGREWRDKGRKSNDKYDIAYTDALEAEKNAEKKLTEELIKYDDSYKHFGKLYEIKKALRAGIDESLKKYLNIFLTETEDVLGIQTGDKNVIKKYVDTNGLYKRLAGETEARNVQSRMRMTEKERGESKPWETQEYPDAEQFVLRESQPDMLYSKNGDVVAFYNPKDDTTYFVADNISKHATDSHLLGLVLHEVGVHALNMGKNNSDFRLLLRRFEGMQKNNPAVKAAFARAKEAGTPDEHMTEEALAYFLEANPKANLAQRVMEMFRQFVRAIGNTLKGMDKLKFMKWANALTEQELRNMAMKALRGAPDSLQFDNAGRQSGNAMATEPAARFYSSLKRAIGSAPAKVFGNANQVKLWLAGNSAKFDVKKDEIYWSGINDWLDMQDKVTRGDVEAFLAANGVRVEDVVLGRKFGDLSKEEMNRFDYLLAKSEEDRTVDEENELRILSEKHWDTSKYNMEKLTLLGGKDYKELVVTIPTVEKYNEDDSYHFGDVGKGKQIAWLRLNTRTDGQGRRVLFLEEVQSQRGADGRKNGFVSPMTDAEIKQRGDGVHPAPFITDANNKATNAYISLLMKKAISEAIDNGQGVVAWTTGGQQADRYNLSKHFDSVMYKESNGRLMAFNGSSTVIKKNGVRPDELAGYLGNEIADKLLNSPLNQEGAHHIEGDDLKTQPAWTQAMYGDGNGMNVQGKPSLVMQAAMEIARRMGGMVGSVDIGHGMQPALIITPKMRQKVLDEGMPLFAKSANINQHLAPNGEPSNLNAESDTGAFSAEDNDIRYSKLSDSMANLAEAATGFIENRKDNPKVFNLWHRTVGSQPHKATVDEHYKAVVDKSMDYEEDAARFMNEQADEAPLWLPKLDTLGDTANELVKRRAWKRLKDAKAVSKAIFDTTLNDKPMTDAELVRDGYTPMQVAMYHQFFAAVNRSMDDLAKSEMFRMGRVMKLLPASRDMDLMDTAHHYASQVADAEKAAAFMAKAATILKLQKQGYAPLMRFGRYTLDVKETLPGGDEKRVFFGMFETVSEMNQMARAFRETDPNYTVTTGTMSQKSWKLFSGVTPETMEVFANMMGVEQDKAFQEYLKMAVNNRSALKRLIHRKKMPGFSQDAQRVLASFIQSNAKMSAKNMHLGDMVQAISAIPKEKGDVIDEAMDLYDYVQNPSDQGAGIRNVLFAWYLGGSVASAMVNLTQTLTTTSPYLLQYGNTKQVGAILSKAMRLAAQRTGDIGGELGAALKLADEEGITAPHETHMMASESRRTGGMLQSQMLRPLTKAWGSLFSLAEAYNRKVAFIAAYQLAKATNKPDAFGFARQAVNDTQFVYNKTARPNWSRGTVGSMLFTFKTFTVNYIEFLVRLPPKERVIALGVLLVLSGLGGMPGADDADDVIDTLGQSLGYNTNAKEWKEDVLSDMFGKTIADAALHGVSAGLPFDVSQRLGVGNVFPATGLLKRSETDKTRQVMELAGPVGGLLEKGIDAWGAAQTRKDAAHKAAAMLKAGMPKAFADAWQALDMLNTGQYSDARGRKVADTNGIDALSKFLGFQPTDVAEKRREDRYKNQAVQLTKAVEGDIASLWAAGMNEKKLEKVQEAKDLLKDWNEKNPETPIRISHSQIVRRVKQMKMTAHQRLLKSTPKELRNFVGG